MLTQVRIWWLQFRFRQIVLELLIAVCLACLVWLYTHNRARNSIDQVAVPVQVQLVAHQQDEYVLELPEPRSVTVSFSGPHSRIRDVRRKLQRGQLKAVVTLTVPAEKNNETMFRELVRIDEDSFAVPAGVKVEMAQENIPVTVYRLGERTLPVRLEYTGEARVSKIKIDPPSVRVRGPKVVLDRASMIPTQAYAVQVQAGALPSDSNIQGQVALVSELEGRPIQTSPAVVQFECRAVPKQKIYQLVDVPIHFLCPKDCPWKPRFGSEPASKVTLNLIGPVTEQPPPVLAFVDLTTGNLARGRNMEPLRLQLPKDFQLAQPATPLVSFYLEEIERATTTGQKTSTD
jgi:hypothetical protein